MLCADNLSLAGRLSRVSAAIRPGEVTAICGPNGAGKSTLLACLAGLLQPDDGNVILGEHSLSAMQSQQRAQDIGYLPQTPEIAWDVSVEVLVSLESNPSTAQPSDQLVLRKLVARV